MPVDNNRTPEHEFSSNAPIFKRRLAEMDEDDKEEERNNTDWKFAQWKIGTFSADVETVARAGHELLKERVPKVGDPFDTRLDDADLKVSRLDLARRKRLRTSTEDDYLGAITDYSRDSQYSHATTRMQKRIPSFSKQEVGSSYVPSVFKEPIRRVTRQAFRKWEEERQADHGKYWPDKPTAQDTVIKIERALSVMSPLNNTDSRHFNPKSPYKGNMVFRGAIAADLATGSKPVYVLDGTSAQGLRKGDYVTNTDIMSTSAVAAVAGEFVMRQRLKEQPGQKTKYVPLERHTDHDSRRVIFTIDHQSGRPIAHYSQETQAEVLFSRGTIFEVTGVDKSDYGNMVRLAERHIDCWNEKGDFVPGGSGTPPKIYNMMTGAEVTKIDVFWPKGVPETTD